jgi:hypothetical protein
MIRTALPIPAHLADINSSAKSVEIIGQILRNRHGDLTKPQLIELAEASFGTGLRFLDFYLELVSTSEEEILGIISNLIKKDDRIDNSKIEKIARRFYVHICYEFTFGVIKKIAFSTGSDKLLGIFDEVSNKEPDSAAIKLINLAIKLEFDSSIPFKLMEELISEFKPNFVAKRMVQQLVIQHLYLHHIDITEKQRISSILGIPINTQRRIQRQRKTKIENK